MVSIADLSQFPIIPPTYFFVLQCDHFDIDLDDYKLGIEAYTSRQAVDEVNRSLDDKINMLELFVV